MSTKQAGAGPPSQAWASGRVLSAEQRARKREVNKESARRLKYDLQERMVGLEKRVASLEQSRAQDAGSAAFPGPSDSSMLPDAPWIGFAHGKQETKVHHWVTETAMR